MFYSKENYLEIGFDTREADTIAKHSNELIDRHGQILYGNIYEDGTHENFTSERKKTDTHVLIGIGSSEMGIFQAHDKPIRKESVTEEDLLLVTQQRNEVLNREIKSLREKNGID